MDVGRQRTDKILAQMEKKVGKEYKQAVAEVTLKLDKYMESFKVKDAIKRVALKQGKITKTEYDQWRTGQIMIGKRWEDMRDSLAKDYHNANNIAKSIVNGYMPEVYALNHNYGTYEVEHQSLVDTSYTLYNRQTVEYLMRDNPNLLPPIGNATSERIAAGKDVLWNERQIQSAMTQSILQGESIPKIAARVAAVVGESNYKAAIRNARTMTTRAENTGRLDSYKRANKMGIKTKKQWIATLDKRTRDSHAMIDGEIVGVDEEFSNGLMSPGADGPPEEVYNCRCGMNAVIDGHEIDVSDTSLRNNKLGDMSYDEWKAQARNRQNERIVNKQRKSNAENQQSESVTKSNYRQKTGDMTTKEYALYKKEIRAAEKIYPNQVNLSREEYGMVMSNLNTHMSNEDRKRGVVTKPIENYNYTVINYGFNEYKIVDKIPIESKRK